MSPASPAPLGVRAVTILHSTGITQHISTGALPISTARTPNWLVARSYDVPCLASPFGRSCGHNLALHRHDTAHIHRSVANFDRRNAQLACREELRCPLLRQPLWAFVRSQSCTPQA